MLERSKPSPGELWIVPTKEFRNKPLIECSGSYLWDIVDTHGPIETHSSLEKAIRARSMAKIRPEDVDLYVDKLRQLTKDRLVTE